MVATAARDAGYRPSGPRQPEIHLARQVEHDVQRRSQRRWRHARPCAEGAAVPAARGPALPRGEGAMRIPPSLRRETVVVRRYLGSGAYGPVYDDPVTYAPPMRGVYVEPGFRRVTNARGEEVVASVTAFFDAGADDIT